MPKLSTKTGLIYTYSRPDDPANAGLLLDRDRLPDRRDGLDASTRARGCCFNNNYAGLALGPDGTAYLGVIGGIVALRDGD